MSNLFRTSGVRCSVFGFFGLIFVWGLAIRPIVAFSQEGGPGDPTQTHSWAPGAINHAQQMMRFKDVDHGSQPALGVIPTLSFDQDPSGTVATYPARRSDPKPESNAFFQNLGTNGRTCFTCHQPQTGWTISAASVQARFNASLGADQLFRLVDGATCPSDDVSSFSLPNVEPTSLLINKGPDTDRPFVTDASAYLQFEVTSVADPYNCTTTPATGLTSRTAGIVSVYRRPLPSTSLGFLSTIMWDGREPSPSQPGHRRDPHSCSSQCWLQIQGNKG